MSKPWFSIVDENAAPPPVATPKGRAAWSEEQKRAVSAARGWTDDSVGRLRTLWKDGDTCAVIASQLSREFDYPYTRNAVIGKVTRLGLSGRAVKQRQPKKPSERKPHLDRIKLKSDGTVAPYFAPTPLPEEPDIPDSRLLTIHELQPRDCRYPIGDPREESFRYCGARTDRDGLSYCRGHMRLAYQPSAQSPRRFERSALFFAGLAKRPGVAEPRSAA